MFEEIGGNVQHTPSKILKTAKIATDDAVVSRTLAPIKHCSECVGAG
jgi:hypothetical protein